MAYSINESDITFEYSSTTLVRSFLESGNKMIDIAVASDGEPLVEDFLEKFPFFEDEATDEMVRRLFASPCAVIEKEIYKIAAQDFSDVASDDISSDIVIAIEYSEHYVESDLSAFDTMVYDLLVYGALNEWFHNSNNPALITVASSRFDITLNNLQNVVRRMTQQYLRKRVLPPIGVVLTIED